MASQPEPSPYDSPRKPGSARALILAAILAFLAGGGLVGWVVWYNLQSPRVAGMLASSADESTQDAAALPDASATSDTVSEAAVAEAMLASVPAARFAEAEKA